MYIRSNKFRYHSGYMGMCRAGVVGLRGLGLRVWGRGALRLGLGGVGFGTLQSTVVCRV